MNVIIAAYYLYAQGRTAQRTTQDLLTKAHTRVYSLVLIAMKQPHGLCAQQDVSHPFPVDSATQKLSQCRFLS